MILKSVRHWRPYLLGLTFTVRTDQRSLKYLMDQRITTPAQARWLPKLLGYDYKIEYKPELANQAANSLSSKAELSFLSISQPQANWWAGLQQKSAEDPFYDSFTSCPHFVHRDGIWFLHGKVYLNPVSPLIPTLIGECHATPQGSHFGFHKTVAHLHSDFRWPKMRHIVQDYIRQCEVYQQNKLDSMSPMSHLQSSPFPTRVWSNISMDFIEGLPPSHWHTTSMVALTDSLSMPTSLGCRTLTLPSSLPRLLSLILCDYMTSPLLLSMIETGFSLVLSGRIIFS